MSKKEKRNTTALGGGTFAHHILSKLVEPFAAQGVLSTLLAMGRFEFNRAVAHEPTRFGRDGILDVSPDPKQLQMAIGNAGSDEIAEANRRHWEPLVHEFISKVVTAYLQAHLADGQTLWFHGFATGHGKPAEEALRELKARLPSMFVLAVSTLPENTDQRQRLKGSPDLFSRFKDEGLVTTTILLDNRSPLVLAPGHDLAVQDRFQLTALASLLAAQPQFSKNRAFAEIGRSLGDYGAFAGMSFASRAVAVAKEDRLWRALRGMAPGLPPRGQGSIDNLLTEAQHATRTALTDPRALAIEEHIDLANKPVFLIYTIPLPLKEEQGWIFLSSQLRRWLLEAYPTAVPVFVSGNGAANPRYHAPYWLQVSSLFPMPDVPAPLREIIAQPALARRVPGGGQAGASAPNGAVSMPVLEGMEVLR